MLWINTNKMTQFITRNKVNKLILLLLMLPGGLSAQKILSASGTAQVKIETNVTKDQTKDIAREMAMINAIENALGTYVEQATDIRIDEGKVQYNIIGTTKVKGDWIRTTDEKFTEEADKTHDRKGQELDNYIICTIKGEVREATPKPMIRFETLSCPKADCRQSEFYSGESVFLLFKSPIDGYLSVFLDDGEKVSRLFPYTSMSGEQYSAGLINGDKEYILFSKKNNELSFTPDELEFYSVKQSAEYNSIFVIFSSKPFEKPILDDQVQKPMEGKEYTIPKSLTYKEFSKWLAQNRAVLPGFIDARVKVAILQKN